MAFSVFAGSCKQMVKHAAFYQSEGFFFPFFLSNCFDGHGSDCAHEVHIVISILSTTFFV